MDSLLQVFVLNGARGVSRLAADRTATAGFTHAAFFFSADRIARRLQTALVTMEA
ncbi:MAG: hypothetical protein JO091_12825 [Acidobacteriaceae bacterium]|nr:hypothetical protein [Acidobacteriaceae bacterium]